LDWVIHAKCQSEDPELFFPVGQSDGAAEQEKQAVAVCQKCHVREHCLEYALDINRQEFGVWGGMGEADRKELLNIRNKARRANMMQRR
jgi:WhiB family redox-sensing transcriptional regulator